jgi:hypothetical protein
MPPDDDELRASTAFGTPTEVIDYLKETAALLSSYPESHLILRLHYPGMAVEPAARAIELLGKEVAPALRAAV